MISADQAPAGAELQALIERRNHLADALAPGDRNEIARTIGQMFLAYQQVKLAPDETRATIAIYVAQVQEFPQWAVAQGCQRVIQRPTAWPPSAGEMRAAVEREAQAATDERDAINSVLNAEVERLPQPGDRERMKAGFRDLVTELGGMKHGKREHTREEAAVWLEGEKANPRPLPKLSAAALKVCGIAPPDTSGPDFDDMREMI